MDYRKLLLQHLDRIDRVIHFIARRHHLSAPDTEEFSSVVRYKLIDRNFAILRKFQGRSNLSTYLTTVIDRLYFDFCISRWGKWRPSASARRLGGVAVLLEQLLARDGLTFEEAVGTLQTNHGVTETREALHALMVKLPVRPVRRFAGEEELALVATSGGAPDPAFDQPEDRALVERIEGALSRALTMLPHRDQLILRMRFQDNLAVAQIARVLDLEPKPLYRRLEHVIHQLRDELRREGIDPAHIDRIVGHPALTLENVLEMAANPAPENGEMRPSKR